MPSLETQSKTGAASNRRTAKKSPMEILYSMMSEDSTASFAKLYSKWKKIIVNDDDHLEAVLNYAFTNFHTQIDKMFAAPKERTNNIREKRNDIAELAKQIKDTILLEAVMINKKKLKDCTFKEVSTFGDAFKLIAAQGKPTQTVGEVLTENDIKKLLAK